MARRQAASSRSAPWRSARPMTGSSDQESMLDHAELERRVDLLERRSRVEMSTEQASSELGLSLGRTYAVDVPAWVAALAAHRCPGRWRTPSSSPWGVVTITSLTPRRAIRSSSGARGSWARTVAGPAHHLLPGG